MALSGLFEKRVVPVSEFGHAKCPFCGGVSSVDTKTGNASHSPFYCLHLNEVRAKGKGWTAHFINDKAVS
jgi:hypothetical protein